VRRAKSPNVHDVHCTAPRLNPRLQQMIQVHPHSICVAARRAGGRARGRVLVLAMGRPMTGGFVTPHIAISSRNYFDDLHSFIILSNTTVD